MKNNYTRIGHLLHKVFLVCVAEETSKLNHDLKKKKKVDIERSILLIVRVNSKGILNSGMPASCAVT